MQYHSRTETVVSKRLWMYSNFSAS